jgi:hypothetical protein
MFFEKFPLLPYTLDNKKTYQLVPDILRRIKLSAEITQSGTFFDQYDVKDGETPEIVANYWYGDPNLHWVILMSNDIIDPRFDWPLSYYNLVEYCKGKYGEENINKLHHYVNPQEYIISGYRGLYENSNYNTTSAIETQSSNLNVQINIVLESSPGPQYLYPISNLMYEELQNEQKRRINILKPSIVASLDSSFTSLINQ